MGYEWSTSQNLNKYFRCVLDTDEAECRRKVVSGRKVTGAIRSLVNV